MISAGLEMYDYHLLFWIGLGLILTGLLVGLSCQITWCIHKSDDTGTSGGFDGCENFCLPLFAPTFVLGGIFCMVGLETWNLVLSLIINIISIPVHVFLLVKCTGCTPFEEDASQAITRKLKTAWIRILPEMIGIGLSVAAIVKAIEELQSE